LWQRHEKLFDGTLGKYTGDKMHIDLLPDAKPHYSRPYPVTRDKGKLLKDELDRMEKIGVIERTGESACADSVGSIEIEDGGKRVRALNCFPSCDRITAYRDGQGRAKVQLDHLMTTGVGGWIGPLCFNNLFKKALIQANAHESEAMREYALLLCQSNKEKQK
ncbi:hypothetical protein THAOC_12187, partial [Thalassiosira oceanica]